MNKFLQDMLKRAKRFDIRDYSVFKVALVVFGIWFAIVVPAVTTVNPRIYLAIFVLCAIYLMRKMFRKEK